MKDPTRETSRSSAAQFNSNSGGTVVSHRWIVNVLAQMIEYSEAHELPEVSRQLISAIEKISPVLIHPTQGAAKADPKDGPGMRPDLSNVFYLHDPKRDHAD